MNNYIIVSIIPSPPKDSVNLVRKFFYHSQGVAALHQHYPSGIVYQVIRQMIDLFFQVISSES
jgi:hypothetical protein